MFVSTNCWAGRNRYLNGASSRAANLRVRTTGQLLRTLLMAACRRADEMLGFNPIKRFGDSVETVDGTPFSAASQGHWNLSYAAEEERRKKVQYFNGQKERICCAGYVSSVRTVPQTSLIRSLWQRLLLYSPLWCLRVCVCCNRRHGQSVTKPLLLPTEQVTHSWPNVRCRIPISHELSSKLNNEENNNINKALQGFVH